MEHGGDWTGSFLDFSANISPLGIPEGVRKAAYDALETADRYPDPLCRRLRSAIAEEEQIPEAWIFCGNGASDLIFRTALAVRPRRALITAPAFSEYETALHAAGCRETMRYYLRKDLNFRLDDDFLSALFPGTDMVFLCQPNNPTGMTVPRELLTEILYRFRETACYLLMDECFLNFLDVPEEYSLKAYLEKFPRLLIVRAFTKFYGMAGLRLGYALCSDTEFLERLRHCGPAWNVSSPAQEAGIAALREKEYAAALRALISRERPRLTMALRALGLRVIPGEANFLLFQSPVSLDIPLQKRGILLRNCGNFHGLDALWYRLAVRTEKENNCLLAALGEVLSWDRQNGL